MRTVFALLTALVAWLPAAGAVAANPPDIAQATQVVGKLPVNLAGAWFLYAQAEFPGGKTRALAPELLSGSQKSGGDVALKILDVQLPKSIYEPYQAASRQTKAWEPTPDDIALLRKQWSKLPPATNKDWRKSEVEYAKVDFTLVAPDKYAETFEGQGSSIGEALSGSLFAFQIHERYRPQKVEPGQNVAQVMERKSIYVVRGANDSLLEGKQFTGYVAAGPGVPIPISFNGPFRLYRLAKGAAAPPASKPASRGRKPAKR
jgi:hypothetical protein